MRKFRLIARREYLNHVHKRSFLVATFGMPLLVLLMMGLSIVAGNVGSGDVGGVGYVDESGVLAAERQNPGFRRLADRGEATAALEAGEITGFYMIPATYPGSGAVELVYWDRQPGDALQSLFRSFLRANLVKELAPEEAVRVLEGPAEPVVRTPDGSRQMEAGGFVGIILPFALGLFISFALMSASGYLMRAISDEKENRTIEIMTTSVSPGQLIVGKGVGLVGVALTQVILWAVVVIVAVAAASPFVDALEGIRVPWGLVGVLAAYFVPLFVFAASLVVTFGVVVADTRQGQGVAGVISTLFLVPLFFSPLLGSDPDGPAMVALTLFPTTSMLTIAIRWGATVLPAWQLVAGWVILAVCAGGAFWVAPRVFRRGMLRYGRRMSLKGIVEAVWSRG